MFTMSSRLFAIVWFSLSSVVVVWDAMFLLLRPRSLPGGDLHYIWSPYELYIWVDKRYGDMTDTFALGQAWLNLVEVCLQVATLTLLLRRSRGALLSGFFVSALTFWKTAVYMIQYTELSNGRHLLAHLEWSHLVFLFLIPNGVWLVIPGVLLVVYGSEIMRILASYKEKKH